MVNFIKTAKQNAIAAENQTEQTIQNSAIKYREETLSYNKLRNQVRQEYYHKVQGCSIKAQEQF